MRPQSPDSHDATNLMTRTISSALSDLEDLRDCLIVLEWVSPGQVRDVLLWVISIQRVKGTDVYRDDL